MEALPLALVPVTISEASPALSVHSLTSTLGWCFSLASAWPKEQPGVGDCPLASLPSSVTDMETALHSQSCA